MTEPSTVDLFGDGTVVFSRDRQSWTINDRDSGLRSRTVTETSPNGSVHMRLAYSTEDELLDRLLAAQAVEGLVREALTEAVNLTVGAGNGNVTRSRSVEEWQRLYRLFSDARDLGRAGAGCKVRAEARPPEGLDRLIAAAKAVAADYPPSPQRGGTPRSNHIGALQIAAARLSARGAEPGGER